MWPLGHNDYCSSLIIEGSDGPAISRPRCLWRLFSKTPTDEARAQRDRRGASVSVCFPWRGAAIALLGPDHREAAKQIVQRRV